jgi:hypothetical protein
MMIRIFTRIRGEPIEFDAMVLLLSLFDQAHQKQKASEHGLIVLDDALPGFSTGIGES